MPQTYPPVIHDEANAHAFDLGAAQIAALDPYWSPRSMVERARPYLERSHLVWRGNLELVPDINERLAGSPGDSTD